MSKYIDQEDVRRFFQLGENCDTCQRDAYVCTYHEKVSLMDVCGMLDDIPAADVVEVRHGHWVDMGDFEQCSVCHGTHLKEFQTYYGKATWVKTAYCHNCGARMDGGGE